MRKISVGIRGLFISYILISLCVSLVCALIGGKVEIDSYTRYYYPLRFQLEEQLEKYVSNLQMQPISKWNSLLTKYSSESQSRMFIINDQSHILAYSTDSKDPYRKFSDYISLSMQNNEEPSNYPEKRTFYAFQPILYEGKYVFLFMQKKLTGNSTTYDKGNPFFTISFGILGFLLTYFILTNNKLKQLKEITSGLDKIAHGDLSISLAERSKDEIGSIATHVNLMASKLKSSIENQQKLEEERMELTTNLSHDVRTPLTSIIGYLRYLLEQRDLSTEQRETYVQIALSKADVLRRLTDQLFLFNKLMYHEAPFRPKTHTLQHLLYQQMEEEVFLLEQAQLQVQMDFQDESLQVEVDPILFVRLMDNLMQNIIRYAVKPSVVRISLNRRGEFAELTVINQAEIIDEVTFSRLFDTFVTGDSARSNGSTGLGLAIVKRIVELHKGSIKARQADGKLTFQMLFPIENGKRESSWI
ncbi:HAMP domain-containing sensor histidine kinase [Shimazuella alba]|uniref:histidine kinase n=1 Tax=Shimazuella alba TaxID=2690964 RepID=A0A6I4VTQ6_9BACL|nr:HAMP domain-containing sensor histidine kinase [Shimazuella alba]MXQ53888.1 HAMP domain-containing protein [Shimazuella alba]